MKLEKIQNAIPDYLHHLQSQNTRFKWEAIHQFQSNWEPVAIDFYPMYDQCISEEFVQKYWMHRPKNFKRGVWWISQSNRGELQQAFQDVLYPRVNLKSRLEHFESDMDRLFKPIFNHVNRDVKNHGHDDMEVRVLYPALANPKRCTFYRRATLDKYLDLVEARQKPGDQDWDDIIKVHNILQKLILRNPEVSDVASAEFGDLWNPEWLVLSHDFMTFLVGE